MLISVCVSEPRLVALTVGKQKGCCLCSDWEDCCEAQGTNTLPCWSLGAQIPRVAAGDRRSARKVGAEADMAVEQGVHPVVLIAAHAELLNLMHRMKHKPQLWKTESLNKHVGSQADSLVSTTTEGNRSGSYRTENAASCILMCCSRESMCRSIWGARHIPHALKPCDSA